MESKKNITNDIVTDYINEFYRPLSPELGVLRGAAEADGVPIILKETEAFLRTFVGILKPKRILEIGTAVGYSAAFFNKACGAEVVTIEKNPEMAAVAWMNLKKLGCEDSIEILRGDGETAIQSLKELKNAGIADPFAPTARKKSAEPEKEFDFLFIDAAKSHYKRFLDAALPLMSKNAVIVCDNVLFQGKTASDIYDQLGKHRTNIRHMREFLDYISTDERFETSIIAVGDGLSITYLK